MTIGKQVEIMTALLALASATTFGVADFLGGIASRRASVVAVAALSQAAGLAVLAVVVPVSGVAADPRALWWGGLAGLAGAGGLVAYFRALAIGPMGVTAPLAAVVGAALPIGVGFGVGERPGSVAVVGIALGIVAVALASRPGPGAAGASLVDIAQARAGLVAAVAAGIGFGVFFVALDAAPDTGGMWPLVSARVAGLTMLAMVIARRRPARPDARAVGIGFASGLLDMVANVLFLLATQTGLLVLVAVLTSLYPVGVVLLARTVLGEQLSRVQWTGVTVAVAATVMVAI